MSETPGSVDYKNEYYYQLKLKEQANVFDELLSRFPAEDEEVSLALRRANAEAAVHDPSLILGKEALGDLKEKQPKIYAKIAPIYGDFLKEKAGIK